MLLLHGSLAVGDARLAANAWTEAAKLVQPGTAIGKVAQERLARYGRSNN